MCEAAGRARLHGHGTHDWHGSLRTYDFISRGKLRVSCSFIKCLKSIQIENNLQLHND